MVRCSIAAAVACCCLVACTGSDDPGGPPGGTVSAPDSSEASSTVAARASAAPAPTVVPPPSDGPDVPATSGRSATAPSVVALPETGVPGLDSDDAFCAAWSRFGGSWQVLAVGSSFAADPATVAEWEVAAAPVIAAAYDDLLANFPDELSSEADVVADGYFGALQRRSADAGEALAATGAGDGVIAEIAAAWLEALAMRDPFSPELELAVGDEAAAVLAAAGQSFASARVEFHLDPSMVVGVETPLTDAYLETGCPDQGTLTGQEVEGG